jgi:hypothetical protein|tara:strand:- start:23 stop:2695 length:2673 start_codon:yes stop_codon:yes gene_type:complete
MADPVRYGEMMKYLTRPSEDKKRMRDYFETNDPMEFGKEFIRRAIPVDQIDVPITENITLGMSPGVTDLNVGAAFDVGGGELSIGGGISGDQKAFGIGFRKEFNNGGRIGFDNGSKPYGTLNLKPGEYRPAEKIPKGYILAREYAEKYNFPIYPKTEAGRAESDMIRNILMRKITASDRAKGRTLTLTKDFFTKELEPQMFKTSYNVGKGGTTRALLYVKDKGKKHATEVLKGYLRAPLLRPETQKNIKEVLENDNIRNLFIKGKYGELRQALENLPNLTTGAKNNIFLRVTQAMSGVKFRDFQPDVPIRTKVAEKLFGKLESLPFGDLLGDSFKQLKYNTITDAIGSGYFTKSYGGFVDDARKALEQAGLKTSAKDLDLNEITGLTNAFRNEQTNSSQFVNFMDFEFNRGAHASMMKRYGDYERALQVALKNGTVKFSSTVGAKQGESVIKTLTPRQLINDWNNWKRVWYNNLPRKYKTKDVRDIIPSFKLGKDPYSFMGEKRLSELLDQGLDLRGEGVKAGYAKTFPVIKDQATLKEIALGIKPVKQSFTKMQGQKGFVSTEFLGDVAKGIGTGVKNVTKYAVLPEAALLGTEFGVRTFLGDTPKEAFDRATDYARPGDQERDADVSRIKRFYGEDLGELVGKVIDFENKSTNLEKLISQKDNLESIAGGAYDSADDLGIQNLNNKILELRKSIEENPITEAEQLTANRIREEAADAGRATSKESELLNKFRAINVPEDDPLSYDLQAPEKTQDELNREVLPTVPPLMGASFRDIQNFVAQAKDAGFKFRSKDLLEERDRLKDMPLTEMAEKFGAEQVFGTQGSPGLAIDLDMSNLKTPTSSRFEGFNPRFAGGGLAKQAGDRSGAMLQSMNPDSQGLSGLLKRGKKI